MDLAETKKRLEDAEAIRTGGLTEFPPPGDLRRLPPRNGRRASYPRLRRVRHHGHQTYRSMASRPDGFVERRQLDRIVALSGSKDTA